MNNEPPKYKYLIALPVHKSGKGFCHPTLLVKAKDKTDARDLAKYLKPHANIGDIKKVDY